MAESPASSAASPSSSAHDADAANESDHDSHAADNGAAGAKHPALKDKECQYCHQHFTSSSLGRHLDQFISKKKPDGVHNVDEIRRLRGGITRRTARGGPRKDTLEERSRTSSQHGATDSTHSSFPSAPPVAPPEDLNRVPPGGIVARLNRLNWQATGVITDPTSLDSPTTILPAPPPPSIAAAAAATNAATASSPSAAGQKRSFSLFSSDLPSQAKDPETARALELALREVLDSLRAASRHVSPKPSPFSFDIHSQTFPSLVLKLLSPPATLFQSSPFSTPTSIPINPPTPDHLTPLRNKITSAVDYWKWNALRAAQPTATSIAEEADFLTRSAAQWNESSLAHLDTAFQNWMAHPPDVRSLLWNVELLRAFSEQKTKVEEVQEELESMRQEATQLQQQVEYLSRCQWPREMALWPPERRTWAKEMREELRLVNLHRIKGEDGSDITVPADSLRLDRWDFDRLVGKWRGYVKEDRLRRMGSGQSAAAAAATAAAVGAESGGTTPEWKKARSDGGVAPGANGTGTESPNLNGDARRPTRLKPNISIVSDY